MDIGKFGLIDVLALFGLVVHELPQEHPKEAQAADDDESPLPAKVLGKRGYEKRCGKGAHGCTGIEDGGCKRAVFLGEIFGRGLDGGREVSGLTKCQDAAAEEEQVHANRGDGKRNVGTSLNGPEGCN